MTASDVGPDVGGTSARRIVIVDDSHDAADGLGELLRLDGHDVHVFYDPSSLLAAFAALRPAIAFLDLGLPQMDGFELRHRVRGLPGAAQCRFYALSGYGSLEDRADTHAAGFDGHLVKPVTFAQLRAAIEPG